MRAKDFDEIEIGDNILIDVPSHGIMKFKVSSIDNDERSVSCDGNILDFYPNEDDQFIIP